MLNPGELKRGLIVEIEGDPCAIENIVVQSPSSRGASQLWKVRARNLRTKQKVDVVYKGGDTVPEPNFEKRAVQFLYSDGSHFHFMDLADYNQFALAREDLEEEANYLVENMEGVKSLVMEDEVIGIELPPVVELDIVECDPSVKGNSATGRTKPAKLETGLLIQVPEHIDFSDRVRVETATGKFVQRVSKT